MPEYRYTDRTREEREELMRVLVGLMADGKVCATSLRKVTRLMHWDGHS